MPFSVSAALDRHLDAVSSVRALEVKLLFAIEQILRCLETGGTIYICGNGGSASDAQHFAAEFTGRYVRERKGLAAVALTTDTSALTAIGNDYGFERIFSRQLEAIADPGDLLIAISTSGNSRNVIEAVNHARDSEIATIGLLGSDGGALGSSVETALIVPVQETARVQEMHIFILHMICEAVDCHPVAGAPEV